MWDYRTRQYDDNYRIGVHKYDDVPEKFRESWDWVTETNVHFHDYLKAFGEHSDAVLLCVRRYERDILDGKLGVTMDDWKTIFKHAVKQSKQVCPNVRYIEVCNEYGCSGFIGCTPDEYYRLLSARLPGGQRGQRRAEALGRGPHSRRRAERRARRHGRAEPLLRELQPGRARPTSVWTSSPGTNTTTAMRRSPIGRRRSARCWRLTACPTDLPMFITEHDPYHPKAGGQGVQPHQRRGAGQVALLHQRVQPRA